MSPISIIVSTIINIDGTSEVANNNIWQMVTGPFVPAIGCGTPAPPSRAASVTASIHRHIGKSAQSYLVGIGIYKIEVQKTLLIVVMDFA